jgi:hypothetical protein
MEFFFPLMVYRASAVAIKKKNFQKVKKAECHELLKSVKCGRYFYPILYFFISDREQGVLGGVHLQHHNT